jgi:hypothetical protein
VNTFLVDEDGAIILGHWSEVTSFVAVFGFWKKSKSFPHMAGLSGVGLYFKQDAGERFGAHVIKRFL